MSSKIDQQGRDFQFKTKVTSMTDSYIEVVAGVGGNEEFDEFDAKRSKLEGKIVSLKQPKKGLFSEMSLKDKQKLEYEEAKLKLVMQQLGGLETKRFELE